MNEKIAEIVAAYLKQFTETKFLSAPGIPPKKLKNAIKAYAPDAIESEVLLLLDTTLFGSAKDGMLLTGEALYAHPMLAKSVKIALQDIQTITLKEDQFSTDIHINDLQSREVASIIENDARLFAQMLKELKAVLSPEGEVTVSEISRISQIYQPRLVPVEGGRLRRYNFINLKQQGSEMGKIVNEHAAMLISPKVVFQGDGDKVYAVTDSKNVSINGEPFSGKRLLADGDLIGLGKDEKMALYQFQANAATHKQRRVEQEAAQGFKRFTGEEKPTQVVNRKFVIDAQGITLKDDMLDTKLSWADFDSVAFSADYDFLYKKTNNLGNAAGQGMALGAASAEAYLKSRIQSDAWAFFPAPNYKVEFLSGDSSTAKLEGVDQRACTMLDQGSEFFAPMDLVIFK